MKIILAAFFFCAAFLSPSASAVTATFITSNEVVTFTGLGGNNGNGSSRVGWGACAFDGTDTTCTVSATYTGIGGGGTLASVLTYRGNGLSPLTALPTMPGGDRITFSLSTGSFVTSLTRNSGGNVTFISQGLFFDFINATCTGIATCRVGLVGQTPGSTIAGLVSGSFDATPVILNVISASNYGGSSALAPGTWMEIYGTFLANVPSQTWGNADFQGNAAPTSLGGTSVTIGGQAAFTYYVSQGQINAQVPSNLASGSQPVIVTTPGGASLPRSITVNATEPGLLSPAVFNFNGGQYLTALFPDGTTFVLPPIGVVGIATARAKPGDTIVLYGVGFGKVNPDIPAGLKVSQANRLAATFQASFAGTPATVAFSGLAAGFLGLYQFNIVVPNVAAGDAVPFTYTLDGVQGKQKLVTAISN